MYTIHADVRKQRLYMVFVGYLNPNEIDEAVDYAIFQMNKLTSGFTAIFDFSRLRRISSVSSHSFQFLQKSLANVDAKLLIRMSHDDVYAVSLKRKSETSHLRFVTLDFHSLQNALQIKKCQCSNN